MPEHRVTGSRTGAVLVWLGGEDRPDLAERHERSGHGIAGVVVLLNAALAWLVATLAVAGSTRWPVAAILPLTLIFGVLVGAVTRAVAGGQVRSRAALLGRVAVAVAVGVIVGELAALVVLSGSLDRRLDDQAARNADSAPAVVAASGELDRTRAARATLDSTVDAARTRRDEALVVARCEYNPSPACPQTQITGVPGPGPETRTADDLLADAQRELDDALADRDSRAGGLDAQVAEDQRALAQARGATIASADRGLGTRWVAMQEESFASPGALALQLLTIGTFVLLSLLPLMLRRWRGETTHERGATARVERERAELDADTAIAVKRAEVRAATETLWAEQQLASARLAVEAQTQIDRVAQQRRVADASTGPTPVTVDAHPVDVDEDIYLPIAAEAAAASLAAQAQPASLAAGQPPAAEAPVEPENLPARTPEAPAPQTPTIPGVAKAAARWIRPLVPPIVARAIDTTTQPLRAARQVFEEVEEITFTLKRSYKVSVQSEQSGEQPRRRAARTGEAHAAEPAELAEGQRAAGPGHSAAELTGTQMPPQVTKRRTPRELPRGPRQLPPAP